MLKMATQHFILADHERRLFSTVYGCLRTGYTRKIAKKQPCAKVRLFWERPVEDLNEIKRPSVKK